MPVLSTHQYRARAVGEFISLDPEAAPEAELDFEQHRLSTAAALGRDSVPTRDAEAAPEAARTITPETTPPRTTPPPPATTTHLRVPKFTRRRENRELSLFKMFLCPNWFL